MLTTLIELEKPDKDLPPRAFRMQWLEEFRTGKIYNRLKLPFHVEKSPGGNNEYIPLCKRRPSVRYGLPSIIVSDSVSLVFGEDHFPAIECKVDGDEDGKKSADIDDLFLELRKVAKLDETFLDAATRGSKGSIVIFFRLLKSRVFLKVMDTQFLTPVYDPEEPDTLISVIEKYKIKGVQLQAMGYVIPSLYEQEDFWFQRIWTKTHEEWYTPWLVNINAKKQGDTIPVAPVLDANKTRPHKLPFCPMVWIKNLPGSDPDDPYSGACTFEAALPNSIEIDYHLSQGGRGLKYASDPTLVLKEAGIDVDAEPIVRSAGNALRIGPNDDARLLELAGTASAAVLDFVRFLREISLEVCGGNRTSPDKLQAAQSGKAMELMNQGLIWLASKLRTSYGEGGLISLLRMVVMANETASLKIGDRIIEVGKLPKIDKMKISLKWPDFYKPTATDLQAKATGITTYVSAGVISTETAIKAVANEFDIEDIQAEIKRLDTDASKKAELAAKTALANAPPKQPAARAA